MGMILGITHPSYLSRGRGEVHGAHKGGYAVGLAVSLLLILTPAVYETDLRGTGELHAA
jgi:hypothetical protein